MATYLKRSSKLFERLAVVNSSGRGSNNNNNSSGGSSSSSGRGGGGGGSGSSSSGREATEPSLRELICPVCRSILREPVTLPCAHNLCLRCLRGTVQHSALSCPLCRQRVGSWLRAATKAETLVNADLWQYIRRNFSQELELTAGNGASGPDAAELDLDPDIPVKKKLSVAGEIRREYEIQLQMAEEEMRRQREKERLASEALIRRIQEEEEQQKLVQLAQDQLLAKTLAKGEVIEKSKDKWESKATSAGNLDKSKVAANQSKSIFNQKMSVKAKDAMDIKKQSMSLMSKIRSERFSTSVKTSSTNSFKESSESFISQKPVPVHNAVTRVVTHQNRINQPNNSTFPSALGELIGSTSKIFGSRTKEELHVPSDILSSKKKKLGVEVCVTKVEGEERISSAESAESHDSINQEIHYFQPIKALPRTPLRVTLDGRQIDPKLIRVLPILKRVSNAVPKPPTPPTHLKKMFGCSWSAFKRISKQQQVLNKELAGASQQEIKKTERRTEQSRNTSKTSKSQQKLDERNAEVNFDSNKNYTKGMNKVVNGTKVSKKLILDERMESNGSKPNKRAGKLRNDLFLNKHKSVKEQSNGKPIEVVELEDDEDEVQDRELTEISTVVAPTTDPLAITNKIEPRPPSPLLELAMENIAERIKRRKTTRTAGNTENVQSAINLVSSVEKSPKGKSKKISIKGRKQKVKKVKEVIVKPKPKVKTEMVTSVTSQIKRLAGRSMKRPRYTEDTESEEEPEETVPAEPSEPPKEPERTEKPEECNKSNDSKLPSSPLSSPSPPKRVRKNAKASSKGKKTKGTSETRPVEVPPIATVEDSIDDEAIIREQERLERLAAQEREDRELALRLQARFNAMGQIAGRTRRGAARLTPETAEVPAQITERRPRKRAPVK